MRLAVKEKQALRHLGDELGIEIGLQRFGAAFGAVAGILDAAERQLGQRQAW